MKKTVSTIFMRLALGAFFVVLGLLSILPDIGEKTFTLVASPSMQWLEVVFGVVELVCGLFLVASAFMRLRERTMHAATLAVLVLWLAFIVLSKFVWGLGFVEGGQIQFAAFMQWLLVLCNELAVAAALGLLARSFRD